MLKRTRAHLYYMEVRKAGLDDAKTTMVVVHSAKNKLSEENIERWPDNYSTRKDILDFISKGQQYIVEEGNEILGTFVLCQRYPESLIEKGKGKEAIIPISVERMTVSPSVKNHEEVVGKALEFAESLAREKGVKKIFFSEYLGCEPCEKVLERKGFRENREEEKKAIEGYYCFEKSIE